MKFQKKAVLLFIVSFAFLANTAYATWHTDNEYKFKIDVPSTWTANNHMEGTDKVYDFTNPNGTIALQIRCFKAGEGINAQTLAQVFDEGLVSEGATQLAMSDEMLSNLSGVMGVYKTNFDGTEVVIISFSAVSNGIGYLIFTIMPFNQMEQLADEADAVLNTFTVLTKPEITQDTPEEDPKKKESSGLSGLLGGTTKEPNSGSETGENYVTISGPKVNGTFNFSGSGSYPIKNQQTVVIRGLDNNGRNALEIYLYNHKGTGTFTYGGPTDGGKHFVVGAVDGKAVSSNEYSGSGECTITEYHEGGMIKGYFTASVGGHDIKGSFSLQLSTPKYPGGY